MWAAECPLRVDVGNMLMRVLSCQSLKGERNDRAVDDNEDITQTAGYSSL